jgi:hypothetical protein
MTTKDTKTEKKPRKRKITNFPTIEFSDAKSFAERLFKVGGGQPVRRLTLFDEIGKSPESSQSRALITAANRYGLTKGGTQAESISLTEIGRKVADESFSKREQTKALAEAAIISIEPFKGLYEKFQGNKLPSRAVLSDTVVDFNVDEENAKQAVDIFVVNLETVGLLQTLSGAERIISIEHLLDQLPSTNQPTPSLTSDHSSQPQKPLITGNDAEYETTAFYITPIGSEESLQRKHSDLFLASLVEPALEEFGLRVVRADQIDKPGVITRQVMEYLVRSRLVIADLSFGNPNVFYELAIRHMVQKPVVQLIQKSDRIPFDVNQLRTIVIDKPDIFTFTPRLQTYRSEIANLVRRALDDPNSVDSPVNWYFSEQP